MRSNEVLVDFEPQKSVAAPPPGSVQSPQETTRGTTQPEERRADEGSPAPLPLVGVKGKPSRLVLADGSTPEVTYVAVEAESLMRQVWRSTGLGLANALQVSTATLALPSGSRTER